MVRGVGYGYVLWMQMMCCMELHDDNVAVGAIMKLLLKRRFG